MSIPGSGSVEAEPAGNGRSARPEKTEVMCSTEVMCCTTVALVAILLLPGALPAWPHSRSRGFSLTPRGRCRILPSWFPYGERIADAFNPLWSIRIYSKTEIHV